MSDLATGEIQGICIRCKHVLFTDAARDEQERETKVRVADCNGTMCTTERVTPEKTEGIQAADIIPAAKEVKQKKTNRKQNTIKTKK